MARARAWTSAIAIGAMALAQAPPALAQAASIAGTWTTTIGGGYARALAVVTETFAADGKARVKVAASDGTQSYAGVYRLLDGGTIVQLLFTSYKPRAACSPACARLAPLLPLDQVITSSVRFAGPSVLLLGGVRYTRQR